MATNDDVIDYMLTNEPTFKGASRDYVAKELYNLVGSPNGWEEGDFYKDLLNYEAPGFGGEFKKGFGRSMEEIGVLATKGASAAGLSGASGVLDYLGVDNTLDDAAKEKATQAGEALLDLEKKYPRSVEHRSEVDSLESALQYAGGLAGAGLGSSVDIMGTALLTGGTSAVASGALKTLGKGALKAAARKAGKELGEEALEDQLGKTMGKAFANGAGIGAYAGSSAAETGSSYLDMLREGNDAPGVAIAAGMIKGALEILPEFGVASRVFRSAPAKEALKEATTKEVFKRFGINISKEVAKTGTAEGLTEATQQAIDIAASQFVNGDGINIFTPEGVDQMIEAGLAGVIGGAPLGALAGAVQTVKPNAVEAPAPVFKEDDLVASSVSITEAIDPSSPNYNKTVAEDFSVTPQDTSPVDFTEAMDIVNKDSEGAVKVAETMDAVLEAMRGYDEPMTSKFNREPQLGRLEGINQADIIETGIDVTQKPETNQKSFTVFNKPVKAGSLPEGVSSFTTKPSDYAEQSVSFRNPLEAKTITEARTVLGLPKTATVAEVIKQADEQQHDGVVIGDNVYSIPKSGPAPVAESVPAVAPTIQDIVKDLNTGKISYPEAASQANAIGYNILRQAKRGKAMNVTNPSVESQWSYRKMPIKKQGVGVEYSRRDNPDPTMYDESFGPLRMMALKQKPLKIIDNLSKLIKDIVGPNAKVDFFESMNLVTQDNNLTPLRGAQWSNVIGVSLGTNATLGTSARETALHEAFHFMYNNVLSQADVNRINSSKESLRDYIAKAADLIPHDIDMFDAEELGATAFGIWADNKLNTPKLGTAARVFNKIANIFKAIKNAFRKEGIRTYEDLFEDIAAGRLAQKTVDNILDHSRLVRTQAAVADAHNTASEYLLKPQAFVSPDRVSELMGKSLEGGALEFTRFTEFVAKKFNTNPGLAAKDPIWSVIFNVMHSKDKNMAIYDAHFSNRMRELYDTPQRLVNASGIMDHLADTNQSVNMNEAGQVVYRKGANVVTLTPAASADVLTLHNSFQDMLKMWRDNAQTKMKEIEGFNTVEEAIAVQQEIVKSGKEGVRVLSKEQLQKAKKRLQALNEAKDTMDKIQSRLASNKAYFPRLANGKYGVTVRLKGKPDQPIRQGFAIIGEDFNGRPNLKQLAEVKARWANELGYSDAGHEFSEPFELNRNRLRRAVGGDANFNLDILTSLLMSDNPTLADEIQESVDSLKDDVAKMYINPRFLDQNDLLLYSKDYASVVPAYFSSGTRSVNNYRYSDAMASIEAMIDSGFVKTPEGRKALTTEQQKLYKEQFDYISNVSSDMDGLRMFNFMFALGGNISTGVLQLITLPTFVTGIMNTYTGNPISNNAIIVKNFGKAVNMLTDSKFKIDRFGDKAFLQKHIKDEDMVNAIQVAYARGEFRPARAEDMLGEKSFTSGKAGSGGYMAYAKGAARKVLGFPVQTGEEISRIAAFMSLYETLREPKAVARFEKNFTEGNHRYKTYANINSDINPAIYAALFAIDDTHGLFGKLGRGKNQQGIFGALLFPFMQHPLMMMGLMNRMMRGNAANKQALAYIILMSMLLAGMYGIPGWELWKESAEMLFKQTTGRETDLHHEFKKVLTVGMGLPPSVSEGLTEGWLKPMGIDISRRIGTPIFFQDALIPLMQGRGGADQFAGVAGSQVRNVMTNYDKMMSGELNPGEALFETVAPNAFKNMYKAAAVWPQQGVRTASGNQIMTPDEVDPAMIMSKFMGFQPTQLSREYEKRNIERLHGTGWRFGYDRRLGSLSRKIHERNLMEDAGEDTTKINNTIDKMYTELYDFAEKAGKSVDRSFNQSVREGLNRRLTNTDYPDDPVREQETVDYGILDLLYERD